MEVSVVSGSRFFYTPDDRLWAAASSPYAYDFWTRYLDVYEGVRLICRATRVDRPPESAVEVTGPKVRAAPVPDFHTPIELVSQVARFLREFKQVLDSSEALHIQAPSVLGNLAYLVMNKRHPFSVEIKGDPFDSFAPGAFEHPLRSLYRWSFLGLQKLQCATADAVTYVTEYSLQERYPPTGANFTTHFSNVMLSDEAFVDAPRTFAEPPRPARLILVGMLQQLNKAPDVVISAVAQCNAGGRQVELTIAGDGQYRGQLEAQACQEGIADKVTFLGKLPSGQAVREALDRADVFVLPSRQEGLPRATIEAMARGLPCIGSNVGGFQELLPPEDRVPADQIDALAQKILEFVNDSNRLTHLSKRNLKRSRQYHIEGLKKRRDDFFRHSRQAAERSERCE